MRVENIIVGNGSDELLALAVRAFVEPARGRTARGRTVQYFTPSYSLYPVLAKRTARAGNASRSRRISRCPPSQTLRRSRGWDFDAALTFVTTPNAPSGRGYNDAELEELCRAQRGVVVSTKPMSISPTRTR